MSVVSIKFVKEINNHPGALDGYGELNNGETYTNYYIYEISSIDSNSGVPIVQYLKVSIQHDSYGQAVNIPQNGMRLVEPNTQTITVWE